MKTETMDPLEAFEKGKGRVLNFARELKAVATDRQDSRTASTLDKLLNRFQETRFLVLAIGEFKRGKSTMINALAGREICPTSVIPKTARVTRIFGSATDREYVEIHFAGEERDPQTIPLDGAPIDELVAMSGKRHKEVSHVDVYLKPSGALLQSGVVLVDTPGLKSVVLEHDQVKKAYLPRADLVLFSLSAIQPMSADEKGFLISHPELLDKTIFVLNRMDEVSAKERDVVINYVKDALAEHVLGSKETIPRLIPISALRAFEAQQTGKVDGLADTGVPALSALIVASLVKDRGYPVLRAIAEGEQEVAKGLVREIAAIREVSAVFTSTLRRGASQHSRGREVKAPAASYLAWLVVGRPTSHG